MKAQVISFHCTLKTKLGRWISSTTNHDVMTHDSATDDVPLKALAEGLQNLQAGEKRQISLRADEAYGFYDPKLSVVRSREELKGADALKLGDQVKVHLETSEVKVYRVVALTPETVTLDANHPLAGEDLVFEIETLTARDATPEELNESVLEPEAKVSYH